MKRLPALFFAVSVSLVAVLIPTLVYVVIFIVATESGTQFAWRHVRGLLPDTFEITALDGRLAGPLDVKGLKVRTETFQLELDNFELEWMPSALVRGMLDIEKITVDGVRYVQLEPAAPIPEEEPAPITLPQEIELPLDVKLGRVSLGNFEFFSQPGAEPFVINSASLTATSSKHRIDILSLKIDSPLFGVEGTSSLMLTRDYRLEGELRWRIPVPEYPVAIGHTVYTGSLREMTIRQTIAKPYDMRAELMLRDLLGNLTFEADADLNPLNLQSLNKDLPPITVQVAVTGKGNPDDIGFHLTGWADDPDLGKVNAELGGGFKSQTVSIDALKITIPDQPAQVRASGQVAVTGDPELDIAVDWQQLQWPLTEEPIITSPRGTIELTGTPENLLAGLDIEVGDAGRIEGKAKRENQVIDIVLDWRDLQWPLQQPEIKSLKGHVAVAGTVDDYSLDMQANVMVPDQTDAELLVMGQGSLEGLNLSRVAIRALEGKLEGKAGLNWKPELKGDVDLVGRGLNPGLILKDWPGKLDVALHAQGSIINDQPSLQLQQLTAQGQLRGYELSLAAAGAYERKLMMVKRFALSSGSTKLEASGKISDTLDVSWLVRSQDLGTILPNASGRINGKGTLAGPTKRPRVAAELTAEEVGYSDYSLKFLNLDADVDLTGKDQSRLSLTLQEGRAAGIELRNIAVNGQGDPGTHVFTLAADTDSGQADIALQGKLENPWQQDMVWDFRLNQARLKYPDLDGWVLQAPSSGSIAAEKMQLSRSCWQSGEALLCLNGQKAAEEMQAEFDLRGLPFSYFSNFLPPDMRVQGGLSGSGAFSQSGSKDPSVTVELKTTSVRLLSRDSNEKQQKEATIIEFQPGDIHLQMQRGGLQAGLKLPLSATDGIQLQAAISQGQGPLIKRPLNGQITTKIEDLDFIADLIPEVQDLAGSLNGRMLLTGSLEKPVLNGRITMIDGIAQLERPGLHLKDIRVELTGEGVRGIRLAASARSGEGRLNIDGTADLQGKATIADINVKGENFRLVDTLEAQVDSSPDLTIALRENRIDVGGEVVIPSAKIKLKTLPESAVKASADQVIIRSEEQEKTDDTAGREIYTRVRIVLGEGVSFEGFGLNARIEGNILAVDKPGEPTTGSGELKIVDGEYRAYGQGLVIEKGRILFAGGPIDQPGLDVRAVRRPEKDIEVGVRVRGNLRQPSFTLFSNPSMTQGNQLSYLVLGRPLSGASGSEGSAMSRAALALGLKGGNAVAEKIGGKLGLDQFGIDPGEAGSNTSPEQASFVVGKYLSPKLYVSYGLGLFDPVSTLRLQYAISSRWELVTESSDSATGGDIIYTIETGK
ncbi:MAG: translocation/assembly module TamB domain-containing protein [Desulforhopalus sp.]